MSEKQFILTVTDQDGVTETHHMTQYIIIGEVEADSEHTSVLVSAQAKALFLLDLMKEGIITPQTVMSCIEQALDHKEQD